MLACQRWCNTWSKRLLFSPDWWTWLCFMSTSANASTWPATTPGWALEARTPALCLPGSGERSVVWKGLWRYFSCFFSTLKWWITSPHKSTCVSTAAVSSPGVCCCRLFGSSQGEVGLLCLQQCKVAQWWSNTHVYWIQQELVKPNTVKSTAVWPCFPSQSIKSPH